MRFSTLIFVSALVLAATVSAKDGGNKTLTAEQQSAKDAFDGSLTQEQKDIMSARKASLNLTTEQKALKTAFKDSMTSNKTRMANTAGFDAIKSELSPDVAAQFNAASGAKSLGNLTDTQKKAFKQASKEFKDNARNETKSENKNGTAAAGGSLAASKNGAFSLSHGQSRSIVGAGLVMVGSAWATLVL